MLMAAEVKDEIVRQTTVLTQDDNDSDPFADLEDKEELDNNNNIIVVKEDR